MICVRCFEDKPSEDFGARRKDCKPCRNATAKLYYEANKTAILHRQRTYPKYIANFRKHDLKRKFNISLSEYEHIASTQNNLCAICGSVDEIRLAVDHCHNTGIIRGLLCRRCNLALGLVKDSVQTLKSMIEYLNLER